MLFATVVPSNTVVELEEKNSRKPTYFMLALHEWSGRAVSGLPLLPALVPFRAIVCLHTTLMFYYPIHSCSHYRRLLSMRDGNHRLFFSCHRIHAKAVYDSLPWRYPRTKCYWYEFRALLSLLVC